MSTALLNRSQVRGEFYPEFEARQQIDAFGLSALAEMTRSVTASETYRFVSTSPQMREYRGRRTFEAYRAYMINVANKKFTAEVMVDVDDIRRDQTGQIRKRIGELADSAALLPVELISELIKEGAAATYGNAYTGTTFFSTSHAVGKSGTINNDLAAGQIPSLNVTAPTAPTAEEASKFIMDCIAYMMGWKDDQGRPINQSLETKFVIHCPATMFGGIYTAITANNLAGGQSNVIRNFNIEAVVNTRLGFTDKFCMFNVGKRTKPFILQTEMDVEIDTLDMDNAATFVKEHNAVGVTADWLGNAAYGDPFSAARFTLS